MTTKELEAHQEKIIAMSETDFINHTMEQQNQIQVCVSEAAVLLRKATELKHQLALDCQMRKIAIQQSNP
jgi:hypothetical protein